MLVKLSRLTIEHDLAAVLRMRINAAEHFHQRRFSRRRFRRRARESRRRKIESNAIQSLNARERSCDIAHLQQRSAIS